MVILKILDNECGIFMERVWIKAGKKCRDHLSYSVQEAKPYELKMAMKNFKKSGWEFWGLRSCFTLFYSIFATKNACLDKSAWKTEQIHLSRQFFKKVDKARYNLDKFSSMMSRQKLPLRKWDLLLLLGVLPLIAQSMPCLLSVDLKDRIIKWYFEDGLTYCNICD